MGQCNTSIEAALDEDAASIEAALDEDAATVGDMLSGMTEITVQNSDGEEVHHCDSSRQADYDTGGDSSAAFGACGTLYEARIGVEYSAAGDSAVGARYVWWKAGGCG